MIAIYLLSGIATAVIAYFSIYYLGKIVDGIQGEERGDLWVPAGFGCCLGAYFFFFAFNMTHGIPASLGLSWLVSVFGTLSLIGLGWLCGKALDSLFKLGDRLKTWSKRFRKAKVNEARESELRLLLLQEPLAAPARDPREIPLPKELADLLINPSERALPPARSVERNRKREIKDNN